MGALLVWADHSTKKSARIDGLMTAIGSLLVIGSTLGLSERTPTAFMVVPCLGAAMMIYGGPASVISRLWSNAAAAYIGRMSYSIYLVRWPLIVLYSYWRYAWVSYAERFVLIIASLLLAFVLHYFIEQPYRYVSEDRWRKLPWGMVASSVVLVVFGAAAWVGDGWAWRIEGTLRPDPKIVAESREPLCVNGLGLCNTDRPEAVLVGDSHAGHFEAAVSKSLRELHITGKVYDLGEGCPLVIGIYSEYLASEKTTCPEKQRQWLAQIERDNPRFVILSGLWENGLSRGVGGRYTDGVKHIPTSIPLVNWLFNAAGITEAKKLFAAHMRTTVERFLSEGRRVVILTSGPIVDVPPNVCLGRPKLFGLLECNSSPTDPSATTFVRDVLREIAASHNGVEFFDAFSYFCSSETHCTLQEGNIAFYSDRHHLSPYGGSWLRRHAFDEVEQFIARERNIAASNSQ